MPTKVSHHCFFGKDRLVKEVGGAVAYAENFHGEGFKVPKFFFALKSKV